MKQGLNIEVYKMLSDSNVINVLAKNYSEVLGIDEKVAIKLIENKFKKHITFLSDKFEKGLNEDVLRNIKNKEDINVSEYLNSKETIKG